MKTKKLPVCKELALWKNNRRDQAWTLTAEELTARFKIWFATKETSWLQYYWLERCLLEFLTGPEPGLQSVFNREDFDGVYNLLKPIASALMDEREAKEGPTK